MNKILTSSKNSYSEEDKAFMVVLPYRALDKKKIFIITIFKKKIRKKGQTDKKKFLPEIVFEKLL